MSATHFSGPLLVGTLQTGETNGPNQGSVVLSQSATIVQNGTNAASWTFYIPVGSRIKELTVDTLTAFDSATSATLTVGTVAGDDTYASGVDVKTAGRESIAYTAAQLAAMSGLTTTGASSPTGPRVVFTVTPVGATTAGVVRVSFTYVQQ